MPHRERMPCGCGVQHASTQHQTAAESARGPQTARHDPHKPNVILSSHELLNQCAARSEQQTNKLPIGGAVHPFSRCVLFPHLPCCVASVRDSIHTIHVHGPGTSPPPRLAPQQSRLYMPSKGLGGYAVGGAARLDLVAFPLPHHQSRHVATRLTRRGYVGPPQATTGVGWVTEVGDCCCWLAR